MASSYVRPAAIPADMGGSGNQLDGRLAGVMEFLASVPLDDVDSVLDIGLGGGQISKWLVSKGKTVTATGIELNSYDVDIDKLREEHGITVVDCPCASIPLPDDSFDAVVLSHVLEHCPDVGRALREVHRVLSENGRLFVLVPVHSGFVSAGHVSMGWNVGQLMYILLLAGFDARDGQFIEHRGSACSIVKKTNRPLPALRGDRGDIHILNRANLLPLPVSSRDGSDDGFWGTVSSINWPSCFALQPRHPTPSRLARLVRALARCIPGPVRRSIGTRLRRLGEIVAGPLPHEEREINPSHLKG